MTTAVERTSAVIATREFLTMLAAADSDASSEMRALALRLLRHYPLEVDIATSAVALPGLWSKPVRGRYID
ncbi:MULTISPECIES: BPSL0761 family protein [Burkholderia]|uniref:BPSL0761 family protein n=1 Tax=Burkholderia TaxID=32008 RepID=UPI0009F569BF|nr:MULTISPECIES: BPSL0761 family protein [Burkholderia]MBO7811049.1 hypothetical protein [Burkholderia pseudomallei]MCA8312408.1 hypothetical protein [Burkholderia sp. AU28942]